MTNALATWFANNLGHIMPAELVIFIVSLFPILECRGGLIVAALLGVKLWVAVPICVVSCRIRISLSRASHLPKATFCLFPPESADTY